MLDVMVERFSNKNFWIVQVGLKNIDEEMPALIVASYVTPNKENVIRSRWIQLNLR